MRLLINSNHFSLSYPIIIKNANLSINKLEILFGFN